MQDCGLTLINKYAPKQSIWAVREGRKKARN